MTSLTLPTSAPLTTTLPNNLLSSPLLPPHTCLAPLSGINEWRSTLVRLRQFESELFQKNGGRGSSAPSARRGLAGASAESRGLIRQRRTGEVVLEDAELRPVAEWGREEVGGAQGAAGSNKRI